jgi:hypothetical protein
MSTTQTFVGTLQVLECCRCSVPFGITAYYMAERREDHALFYCPNGHGQSYQGETPKERELRQAKADKDWYSRRNDELRLEAEQSNRRAAAARGQVTRIKKRVSKGVCPCCNRHFADLHRHMQGQHPEWQAEQP